MKPAPELKLNNAKAPDIETLFLDLHIVVLNIIENILQSENQVLEDDRSGMHLITLFHC